MASECGVRFTRLANVWLVLHMRKVWKGVYEAINRGYPSDRME